MHPQIYKVGPEMVFVVQFCITLLPNHIQEGLRKKCRGYIKFFISIELISLIFFSICTYAYKRQKTIYSGTPGKKMHTLNPGNIW